MATLASNRASLIPIQFLLPIPNGSHMYCCSFVLFSGKNLQGLVTVRPLVTENTLTKIVCCWGAGGGTNERFKVIYDFLTFQA
jgi:hypothetical protein